MQLAINIFIGLVAFIHLYILWMEMFSWESKGPKVFSGLLPKELFSKTTAMAANQGLYNGFLAAGLIWTFFIGSAEWSENIALFFLGCVFVAGLYGAVTVDKKTIFVQVIPSLIPIVLILIS